MTMRVRRRSGVVASSPFLVVYLVDSVSDEIHVPLPILAENAPIPDPVQAVKLVARHTRLKCCSLQTMRDRLFSSERENHE